ncbi:MAG: TRAP transporter substrate-binding protein [Bacteroidota bacterium]
MDTSKISRKSFLIKGATALAGASVLGAACGREENNSTGANVSSSKKFKWKLVTTWPPGFPVLDESNRMMADWVRAMSNGRLDITVYGGGKLVPPLQVFDTVSKGTAEMGNGAAYYWAGKTPAAQFFASVPFGMNAQQVNSWIVNGGGQALWDEVYAPFDLMGFPAGNTGVQMGGWFNKEINSIDDINGLKMRIPGIGGKVIAKAGGTAATVAGGEIYTNLERGVIDATEWIGPYHDYKMGFQKIAKYYYFPGWHEPGTNLETIINKNKFNTLPPDLQMILTTALYRQNVWVLGEFEAKNNLYLKKMMEEDGVELRAFPQDVLDQLRVLTDEVIQEITDNDPLSKKVYEAYRTFQVTAAAWSEVTEKAFYNTLQTGSVPTSAGS